MPMLILSCLIELNWIYVLTSQSQLQVVRAHNHKLSIAYIHDHDYKKVHLYKKLNNVCIILEMNIFILNVHTR